MGNGVKNIEVLFVQWWRKWSKCCQTKK